MSKPYDAQPHVCQKCGNDFDATEPNETLCPQCVDNPQMGECLLHTGCECCLADYAACFDHADREIDPCPCCRESQEEEKDREFDISVAQGRF